jgi:hypothetical protein
MMDITEENKKKYSKNLEICFELTSICVELRKGYLKQSHPDLSDKELEHMVYAEAVKRKEEAWLKYNQ